MHFVHCLVAGFAKVPSSQFLDSTQASWFRFEYGISGLIVEQFLHWIDEKREKPFPHSAAELTQEECVAKANGEVLL